MQRKVPQNMTDCFQLIRNPLPQRRPVGAGRPVFGGRWLPVHRGQLAQSDGVDIALFPKVHAHTQRMLQRPAVQRALA